MCGAVFQNLLVECDLRRRASIRLRVLSFFYRRLTAALGVVAQRLHAFRDQHRPNSPRNRGSLAHGSGGRTGVLGSLCSTRETWIAGTSPAMTKRSPGAKPLTAHNSRAFRHCGKNRPDFWKVAGTTQRTNRCQRKGVATRLKFKKKTTGA